MFDLGPLYDKHLEVEALSLDAAEIAGQALLQEMFPVSATELVSRWEARYGITPQGGATLAQRRAAVMARERATGGLSRPYFEGIAIGMGYKIGTHESVGDPHLRIIDGQYPAFRADINAAEDTLWETEYGGSETAWTVLGYNVATNPVLQEIFTDLKPAGTEVLFVDE